MLDFVQSEQKEKKGVILTLFSEKARKKTCVLEPLHINYLKSDIPVKVILIPFLQIRKQDSQLVKK